MQRMVRGHSPSYPLMKTTNIMPEDWKYMEQNPYGDPDFSEEHNRRVIAEVDAHNDRMEREREREYSEKTRERASAVSSYLENIKQGKGVSSIDKYFGKRHAAYLRGVDVVNQLKANPALLEKLKKKMANKRVKSM